MKLVSQSRQFIPPPNTLKYQAKPGQMPRKSKAQRLRATNANAAMSNRFDRRPKV